MGRRRWTTQRSIDVTALVSRTTRCLDNSRSRSETRDGLPYTPQPLLVSIIAPTFWPVDVSFPWAKSVTYRRPYRAVADLRRAARSSPPPISWNPTNSGASLGSRPIRCPALVLYSIVDRGLSIEPLPSSPLKNQ